MIEEKSCGCIIIEKEKVLLIESNRGNWGFPKGHVEKNETEIETATREVKEETNLDVKIYEEKRLAVEYITDKGKHKQSVYFLADMVGGILKPQESEVKNIGWFDFEDALKRLTYDNDRDLLRKAGELR